MKAFIIFLGLWVAILFVRAVGAAGNETSAREILFTLTQQKIVSIEPGKDKIREAFDFNGGAFQILIPKELFPIPAPNCRKNVILSVSGTNPDALYSNEKLDLRWKLFQSLNAVFEGKIASVEVPLEIKHSPGFAPYMRLDKQGNPVLEWCNAWIQIESASEQAAARAAHKRASAREMLFNLTQQNIAGVAPAKDTRREMFDQEQGGEFEVRIPKALFPIPAPKCRDNVLLRIPALNLSVVDGSWQQDRWKLFQSLHAVAEGKMKTVEVSLRLGVEMGFDKQGNPVLESCNAYINANTMGSKSFTPVP